jgi:hypothetical protein
VTLGTYFTVLDAAKIVAIAKLKIAAAPDVFAAAEPIYKVLVAERKKEKERQLALVSAFYAQREAAEEEKRAAEEAAEEEWRAAKKERAAIKAAEREERLAQYEPLIKERADATWTTGTRTDVFAHPLYWIKASTQEELEFVMNCFGSIEFQPSFQIQSDASELVAESCKTLLTKQVSDPKFDVDSLLRAVSPSPKDSQMAFVLHGQVQTRGAAGARKLLNETVRSYLGNCVNVYGLTWRYMVLKDGTTPGNTAPHVDTFSGYQVLISFNIEGTFQLQISKGGRVVALGPPELAGTCQVLVMAGAHSHEIALNPCHLLHSGLPSEGCRRLLLRISLKGDVDAEKLKDCNFLNLAKEIANLKKLKFFRAL